MRIEEAAILSVSSNTYTSGYLPGCDYNLTFQICPIGLGMLSYASSRFETANSTRFDRLTYHTSLQGLMRDVVDLKIYHANTNSHC